MRDNRDFNRFWLGETISLVGNQVTVLALPLAAIESFDASDEQVGVLRFLQLAPFILLALPLGVWVDRSRRRPIMIGANVARLALLCLVPALAHADRLGMSSLLLIATLIGVASVVFDVAWMAYLPTVLRGPEDYPEASAKMGMSSSASDVAGPGLAGLLVSALSATVALLVDALSYVASVWTLMSIRTREARPPRGAARHIGAEFVEGLQWVVMKNPVLRALALVGFCCNFSMVAVWTMFLLYGTRDLELGSAVLGGTFAMASVGGLVGASLSRRIIARHPLGRVYLVAQTILLSGPILIPLASGPRVVMLSLFVLSFFATYLALGVANVVIVSLRQAMTPPALMGRMTAVFRTLLFGGGALGGLAAGLLTGGFGARTALAIVAAASVLVAVSLRLSPVVALARLPESPPAV